MFYSMRVSPLPKESFFFISFFFLLSKFRVSKCMFRVSKETVVSSFECVLLFRIPNVLVSSFVVHTHNAFTESKKKNMRPSRVSHSASIGPGVVPRGVDPDYDAEVAKEYEARKHVAHHRKSETTTFIKAGRPFSIDPNAPTTRTQYVK